MTMIVALKHLELGGFVLKISEIPFLRSKKFEMLPRTTVELHFSKVPLCALN